MKELPERIKFKVKDSDEEHVVVRERIPQTMGKIGYRYEGETELPSYFAESLVRNSIESGHWTVIEEPKPFEIPASPFYVRGSLSGCEFKIDVIGLYYTATDIKSGEKFGPSVAHLARNIPAAFKEGHWTLIDPPAPAVDPVVAATAEVQRLLREYQAAVKAGDEADAVAEKAAENRRNIGKQLEAAKRDLEKANHEAVGIEYSDKFGANYSR